MSAWLALTDATVENGCLHIAPGSHELGYLSYEPEAEHGQRHGRAGQAVLAEAGFGHGDAVPLPVAAGDAVPACPDDVEDLDGWTLHRLRHSALTHDAEGGTSTPMRLARSRQASVRSLAPPPDPEGRWRTPTRASPTSRRGRPCQSARYSRSRLSATS